jgi:DNA-binding GntR family transcriptional regulator
MPKTPSSPPSPTITTPEADTPAALSDEDIHRRMIEAIVDQRLLPGTKLVEDKLGQAFGVSRTRIRQVLIRLAQEQVVTILPNKGASVAQPTVDEAREVFEARCVIEAVLVRRFIERAKAADLKALAACIDAEEVARKAGDHAMALRHSGRFHLLLADAAGHRTFEQVLRKLVSRTSLILMSYAPAPRHRAALGAEPVRWVQACRCDEHRGLLTALRGAVKGKVAADDAVSLMTRHLHHIEAGLCFNEPHAAEGDFWQALAAAPMTAMKR